MLKGQVKMFNAAKGYGFISRDGFQDVFFHHSGLEGPAGFKTLAEGDRVQFELAEGRKGLQAVKVRKV